MPYSGEGHSLTRAILNSVCRLWQVKHMTLALFTQIYLSWMQSQMMLDTGLYMEYVICSFMIYLGTNCYLELKKSGTIREWVECLDCNRFWPAKLMLLSGLFACLFVPCTNETCPFPDIFGFPPCLDVSRFLEVLSSKVVCLRMLWWEINTESKQVVGQSGGKLSVWWMLWEVSSRSKDRPACRRALGELMQQPGSSAGLVSALRLSANCSLIQV